MRTLGSKQVFIHRSVDSRPLTSFLTDPFLMTASPLAEDCVVVVASPPSSAAAARLTRFRRTRLFRSRLAARLGGFALLGAGLAGAVIALVGLAGAARKAPWQALLASPWIVALMLVATVVGYLMQSFSMKTLLSRGLPNRDALMLPWACASVNRVTPGSTGGLLLTTRVFHRRGVTYAGSAVYLASVGVTHTLGGLLLLGVAVAAGGVTGQHGVPLAGPGLLLSMLGLITMGVLACIPRTRSRALALIRQARGELSLRRLPVVILFQAGARLAPAVVLAGALAGLHHPLPFPTVVMVVLVASATGSLIPLPGGGGGVELALTGLLTASGLSLGAASGAVLVARLVGFWLPAALGFPALLALRRSVASVETGATDVAADRAEVIETHGDQAGSEGRLLPALLPSPVPAAA